MHPVLQGPLPWHLDHAGGDYCAACHGGDRDAEAAFTAHATMVPPLAAPELACGGCHADAVARADRYLSRAVASPVIREDEPGAPALSIVPGQAGPRRPGVDRALAALVIVLGGVIALLWRRGATARPWVTPAITRPLIAGALLGVVVAISEVGFGRPLAASGAFDKLAAYVGVLLWPDRAYYRFVMPPGVTWQVWLMVGVLLGALASSRAAGEARWRWLPDTQWVPRFGSSRARRLGLAFAGAVLVQLGAGIAGGCTSGLAISGGAVLAPAAFVFMAGMFAGGIPAAWLVYRHPRSPR